MAQYVEARAAYEGQVRKVVLLHILPSDHPDRVLVSIDVLEHLVRDGGFFRARRGPRVERKVVLQEMTDGEARATAERIARESGTLYISIVRDGSLFGEDVQAPHDSRDAAD
ncbi:MAG TPA: hypothetical protein VHM01_15095 [Alphaproteobacteria bacterium]|nr:hypothetical protein [Alphaproteobacteria bacterium]